MQPGDRATCRSRVSPLVSEHCACYCRPRICWSLEAVFIAPPPQSLPKRDIHITPYALLRSRGMRGCARSQHALPGPRTTELSQAGAGSRKPACTWPGSRGCSCCWPCCSPPPGWPTAACCSQGAPRASATLPRATAPWQPPSLQSSTDPVRPVRAVGTVCLACLQLTAVGLSQVPSSSMRSGTARHAAQRCL